VLLFYILLSVFVTNMIAMTCWIIRLKRDCDYYENKSDSFNTTLSAIRTIVYSDDIDPTDYDPWTSTNHSDDSTSSTTYRVDAKSGDIFSFDYTTDTERYSDQLQIYTSLDDDDTGTLYRKISGLGQSGTINYRIPRSGHLTVRCVYHKDGSISDGADLVRVYNVRYQPTKVGAVISALDDCPYYITY
ncbi:MAG: hypothetical protein K2K86_08465, partial [Muribaculaceae bacterium]|nr:hypothetical protein [Muribaculaceae bacterium]